MNKTSISIVLLLLLCAAVFAADKPTVPAQIYISGEDPELNPNFGVISDTPPLVYATDDTTVEIFGDQSSPWSGGNRDRGNIFQVTTTVNLYEHRFFLDASTTMPVILFIFQGTAAQGVFNLVDSVTVIGGPGLTWFSSGERNFELQAGSFYYLGASWVASAYYYRGGPAPPIPCTFGQLATWIPGNIAGGGALQPQANNTYSNFPAYHAAVVTGFLAGPNAPQSPENFTVAHNQAQLTASLAWINPDSTFGGVPLTDLDGIKIFRGPDSLTTLTNVQIGQASSYDDNTVPAAGMYDYCVIAFNDSGDSPPANASAWIGLDVPAAPTNVTTNPDTQQCVINWTAPTAGAHGAYWPAGSWTGQKIYRDGTEIADLPGTNTNYTDTPSYQGNYVYGVAYYNASGVGDIAEAPPVFVPGPEVYMWEAINYDWVEINTIGANSGINGDDQNLGPYPLGFSFPFYPGGGPTEDFTDIRICSNGFLSFTSTSTAYSNLTIPTAGEPENVIALLWDDLNPSTSGTVWVYNDSVNNRWICEFENVPYFGGGGTVTCEAILYADGTIELMFNTVTNYSSCTIGVENQDGSEGVLLYFNGAGVWTPANQTGVRIHHPGAGSPLSVTLTPHNPPIQVPPGGGQFVFDAEITNNSNDPQIFDGWTEVILPNGAVFGPLVLRTGLPIAPGQTIMRIVSQNVPGMAPPGNYTYVGNAGTHPATVIDCDTFPFSKLAGDATSNCQNWNVSGWFGDETSLSVSNYALSGASPNPFNPTTNISFTLPEAGKITLSVFDITGREVAVLANGWYNSGAHQVVFDGSGLSSGIYFYKLTAGDFSDTKKMALVK